MASHHRHRRSSGHPPPQTLASRSRRPASDPRSTAVLAGWPTAKMWFQQRDQLPLVVPRSSPARVASAPRVASTSVLQQSVEVKGTREALKGTCPRSPWRRYRKFVAACRARSMGLVTAPGFEFQGKTPQPRLAVRYGLGRISPICQTRVYNLHHLGYLASPFRSGSIGRPHAGTLPLHLRAFPRTSIAGVEPLQVASDHGHSDCPSEDTRRRDETVRRDYALVPR